jgi:hypothetical protein
MKVNKLSKLNKVKPVVLQFPVFVDGVRFPRLNKQDFIGDYESQLANPDNYHVSRVRVTEVVELDAKLYDEFANNLLDDQPWLSGKGGTDSTYDVGDKSYFDLSDVEKAAWKSGSYSLVIAVQCVGKSTLYVDPQGYSYARYVGFDSAK